MHSTSSALDGKYTPVCPGCGGLASVELFEAWESGEFMLDTCCGYMLEVATESLNEDPGLAAEFMRGLKVEELLGGRLRRVLDSEHGTLVLDWNPSLIPVSQSSAKQFVRRHHEHCKAPPAGWKFGVGIRNGFQLIGVTMVGRPVSRRLDDGSRLEVNRLCVRRDLPRGLAWNACSMLYSEAAKRARKLGYQELITYTLDTESAVSLKASGWKEAIRTRGGSWSRSSRPRCDKAPTTPKVRWYKALR